MGFARAWDSSCPFVWDSWEANGKKWVIQDLPPEDEEEAVQVLLKYLCTDEVLNQHSNLAEDAESMRSMAETWRKYLAKHMSIACYVEENGKRKLASVNVCYVVCEGEVSNDLIYGESRRNLYNAIAHLESKADKFEYLGLDKLLSTRGLVVVREFRGAGLGTRMLEARELLCRYLGIQGTVSVFSSLASQKSAERAGFETIATVNMKELAEAGLKYPRDESKEIKLMVKKYDKNTRPYGKIRRDEPGIRATLM